MTAMATAVIALLRLGPAPAITLIAPATLDLDGFSILCDASRPTVGISIAGNGATGFVIRSTRTHVQHNRASGNGGDGIEVSGSHHLIIGNDALGNRGTDLVDTHPSCDDNAWRKNSFDTRSPA